MPDLAVAERRSGPFVGFDPWRPLAPASSREAYVAEQLKRTAFELAPTEQGNTVTQPVLPAGVLLQNREQRRNRPLEFDAHVVFRPPRSMAERLSSHLLAMKVQLAMVASSLTDEMRFSIANQLNLLLLRSRWPEGLALPRPESFLTFLRAIAFLKPSKRISIGIADNGDILGTWIFEDGRLAVEFLPMDMLRWASTQASEGANTYEAGGPIVDLLVSEENIAFRRWFEHG